VKFEVADAFALDGVAGDFDAGFAGFWWSHVSRARIRDFLRGFHARFGPAALVVLIDNRYVEGSNWPITRRDVDGNTYQQRRLDDGSEHEVLKNFPDAAELGRCLTSAGAGSIEITELSYYWAASYVIGP
jgi:demethylmenaquinone methyltransferase/2-methoxy-6-polyprenyl-1,4-benzoquinol methylase